MEGAQRQGGSGRRKLQRDVRHTSTAPLRCSTTPLLHQATPPLPHISTTSRLNFGITTQALHYLPHSTYSSFHHYSTIMLINPGLHRFSLHKHSTGYPKQSIPRLQYLFHLILPPARHSDSTSYTSFESTPPSLYATLTPLGNFPISRPSQSLNHFLISSTFLPIRQSTLQLYGFSLLSHPLFALLLH